MNAFVKKEIRLLLPVFLLGCAATLATVFLPFKQADQGDWRDVFILCPMLICPALAIMLVLNSFGSEVNHGTFSNLLAQPVSRVKIWQTKILLLALALFILEIFWLASMSLSPIPKPEDDWFHESFVTATLFALAIFSGGLWTVLLLRQVAAAFWFTVLIPAMIAGGLATFFSEYSGEVVQKIIAISLGIYTLTGFFFARWLFFRAQDVQWSGGTIEMPEMRGLAWAKSSDERRTWQPRAALWRKEFLLHQSQYVMAFVLLLMHLGVLAVRKFGHFHKNSTTEYILETVWTLWMVLPLLIGCAAVAEERKLGTLGGQLCLPVKGRTQFAVKLITIICLSIFFGVVMPLLLEGSRILPSVPKYFFQHTDDRWVLWLGPEHSNVWTALLVFSRSLPILIFGGFAVLIGLVSFYASSLARNTLQALGPAVFGVMLLVFLAFAGSSLEEFDLGFLWQGQLHFLIAGPLVLGALVWFAAQNFRQLSAYGKLWARNGLKFLMVLLVSILATSAVYHRVWEKLTPFEPVHGAAKLSLSDPAQLDDWSDKTSVRLPDGRVWSGNYLYGLRTVSPAGLLLGNMRWKLDGENFLSGSNWLTLRSSSREFVGIKTDGTLWLSEGPGIMKRITYNDWRWETDKMTNLVRYGGESDWSSGTDRGNSAYLTKSDGTLWRLGQPDFRESSTNFWPGLRKFMPERVGAGSNWKNAVMIAGGLSLEQADGSLWAKLDGTEGTNFYPTIEVEPDYFVGKLYDGKHGRLRSTTWLWQGTSFKAGICEDGTFRIWAAEQLAEQLTGKKHYGYYEWRPADVQIGSDTNWIAVAGSSQKIITLKNDGTLWLWDFRLPFQRPWNGVKWPDADLERELKEIAPRQLGSHSDWIAISGRGGNVTALAADGSLWYWPVLSAIESGGNNNMSQIQPLLDVSHKPQYLGNVFAATP